MYKYIDYYVPLDRFAKYKQPDAQAAKYLRETLTKIYNTQFHARLTWRGEKDGFILYGVAVDEDTGKLCSWPNGSILHRNYTSPLERAVVLGPRTEGRRLL